MLDVLKEQIGFLNERIKSPIVGSITFVFLMLNWRVVFNLIFSDASVLERIEYFDANSSFLSTVLFPLTFGLMLAVVWQWVVFLGAMISNGGVAARKKLQIDEVYKIRMYRLDRDSEHQKRVSLVALEREAQIEEMVQKRNELKQKLGEAAVQEAEATLNEVKGDPEDVELTVEQESAIILLGLNNDAVLLDSPNFGMTFGLSIVREILNHDGSGTLLRTQTEIRDAIVVLEEKGLCRTKVSNGVRASLTGDGYKCYDRVRKKYHHIIG